MRNVLGGRGRDGGVRRRVRRAVGSDAAAVDDGGAVGRTQGSAGRRQRLTPERQDAIERTFQRKTAGLQALLGQGVREDARTASSRATSRCSFEIEPSGKATNVKVAQVVARQPRRRELRDAGDRRLDVPRGRTRRCRTCARFTWERSSDEARARSPRARWSRSCWRRAHAPPSRRRRPRRSRRTRRRRRARSRTSEMQGRRHARHARRGRDRGPVPARAGTTSRTATTRSRRSSSGPRRQDRAQAARRRRTGDPKSAFVRVVDARQLRGRALRARHRARAALRQAARRRRGGVHAIRSSSARARPVQTVGRGARCRRRCCEAIARRARVQGRRRRARLPPALIDDGVRRRRAARSRRPGWPRDAPLDDAFAECLVGKTHGVAARRSARARSPRRPSRVATSERMIDFELTDEQRLVRDTARDFAERVLAPQGGGARSLGRVSRRGAARARPSSGCSASTSPRRSAAPRPAWSRTRSR